MWRACLVLVVVVRTAHADTSITIDAKDLPAAVTGLVEHHDEPVGLVAVGDAPALGLVDGDLVRAINGHTATRMSMLTEGVSIFYLDVQRGATSLVVRIAVKLDGVADTIRRDHYKDRVDQLERLGPDLITKRNKIFVQITKAGKPSGVMVRYPWFGFGTMIEGDVIRKIDGTDIVTVEEAIAAFARAKKANEVAITVDRLDQTVTKTLKIEDTLAPDPGIAAAPSLDFIADDGAPKTAEIASSLVAAPPKPEVREVRGHHSRRSDRTDFDYLLPRR